MVMKKLDLSCFWPKTTFSTYYDPKYLQNTFETVLNLFIALKTRKSSQKPKFTRYQKSNQAQIFFFHEL
jgi:hypothetical protein